MELERHLAALSHFRVDWPTKVIDAKRRLAGHVLESDGCPLSCLSG